MTDPAALTARGRIPDTLAAEIAAHPERFRPAVAPDQLVLILAAPDAPDFIGRGGPVFTATDVAVSVDGPTFTVQCVTAWALVGSVGSGPRPEIGQRVLILECDYMPEYVGTLAGVGGTLPSGRERVTALTGRGDTFGITRWALLPPAVDVTTPVPAEPSDRDATRKHPAALVRVTHWDAEDGTEPGSDAHPAGYTVGVSAGGIVVPVTGLVDRAAARAALAVFIAEARWAYDALAAGREWRPIDWSDLGDEQPAEVTP